MESEYQIFWGMLFGVIGFSYFIYGKKQNAVMPFFSGIALCVFPYFVSNVYIMVLIGAVLLALPYFIKV